MRGTHLRSWRVRWHRSGGVDYRYRSAPRHIFNEMDGPFSMQGGLTTPWGTLMIQTIMFAIALYLTPSLLLVALMTCREGFDYQPH
jgi:hypothetical protein